MKFIEFKLSSKIKLLNLILLGLINFNFSTVYSLHIFGGKKETKNSGVSENSSTGVVLTMSAAASEHASAGAAARVAGSSLDSVDSRTDSAGGGASGAGASGVGGWFKSHSDGDLSTLLARTATKVGSLETSQRELGIAMREETSTRAAALTRLDSRLDELVSARTIRASVVDRRLGATEREVADLRARLTADTRLRELENKEAIRDGLKIAVPAIVDGVSTHKHIRLSPASKDAYDLHLCSLNINYESVLERAVAEARNPQDNTHADDKKLLEGTALESAADTARELTERVGEKLTWPKMLAAGTATGLAVWLARRRT